MARNTLKLNMKGFEELLRKLSDLDGELKPTVEKALNKAADIVTKDTIEGVKKPNLPAGGMYSGGDTEKSIVKNPKVEWQGNTAEVAVGFDYNKPGAGGYLISGRYSPTVMKPAAIVNKVYTGKGYINKVNQEMQKIVNDEISKKMNG